MKAMKPYHPLYMHQAIPSALAIRIGASSRPYTKCAKNHAIENERVSNRY